jgi:hypothetical protein
MLYQKADELKVVCSRLVVIGVDIVVLLSGIANSIAFPTADYNNKADLKNDR